MILLSPLYMKSIGMVPFSKSAAPRVRSACPGERTPPLNYCFDMASEPELAELIQLGYDM